ncbi:hypothetical protein [Actinomycetospora sp.]|jgi:hypothetical protein|uniref:hypothetical protein n=1 Tax=Actinomycetospora sp. TaxID=1872135 RepID=UPI002F416C44
MTESERIEGEQRYRDPPPAEVRDPRDSGALPGLMFDDVTGRVIRTGDGPVPEEESRPGADGGSSSEPGPAHVPDRGPSRVQRRTDGRAMIPLLSQALSSQLTQLADDDDPVPGGWWFTPDTDR